MKFELTATNSEHMQKIADLIALRAEKEKELVKHHKELTPFKDANQVAAHAHRLAWEAVDDSTEAVNQARRDHNFGSIDNYQLGEIQKQHRAAVAAQKTAYAAVLKAAEAVKTRTENTVATTHRAINSIERAVYESAYAHEQELTRHAREIILRLFALKTLHGDHLNMDFEKFLYTEILQLPSQFAQQHGVRDAAMLEFGDELKALYLGAGHGE